jgi:hypothetical protein
MQNVTAWIPAHEVRVGDWVEGEGVVKTIRVTQKNGYVFITYEDRNLYSIFGPKQQIEVRLEDDGR